MPHPIEVKARKYLIRYLKRRGYQSIGKSTKKTFDLVADGELIELKGKGASFRKIDFIGLSKTQYEAITTASYTIYLVCGLNSGKREIYRVNPKDLLKLRKRVVTSFEYDRNELIKVAQKV